MRKLFIIIVFTCFSHVSVSMNPVLATKYCYRLAQSNCIKKVLAHKDGLTHIAIVEPLFMHMALQASKIDNCNSYWSTPGSIHILMKEFKHKKEALDKENIYHGYIELSNVEPFYAFLGSIPWDGKETEPYHDLCLNDQQIAVTSRIFVPRSLPHRTLIEFSWEYDSLDDVERHTKIAQEFAALMKE